MKTIKKQYAINSVDNSTIETGDAPMNNMNKENKRWEEITTTTNMAHNSHKAWKTQKLIVI